MLQFTISNFNKPLHSRLAMTNPTKITCTIFLVLCLLSLFSLGKGQEFSRRLARETFGMKKEKLSHLHFYFHDIVSGRSPTAVRVAEASMTNTSATGFGAVIMIDDPLTMKPELNSTEVGRAQGIYASASQKDVGLLMVLNFVFTQGKYNGSTLSILGRNSAVSQMREMPVVGGSEAFRFARGYAHAHTHWINLKTGDAIVEYNVYVLHY